MTGLVGRLGMAAGAMDTRRTASRRHWLVRVCAGVGVGGWVLAAAAAGAAPPPDGRFPNPAAADNFHGHFAGMQLLDQSGRRFQPDRLRGKVVLFNFIFTGCSTVCPVQTHALAQMLQQMPPALRARVHVVSVSLDPLSDTPQTLAAFARRYPINHADWSFVTGRPDDIQRLADRLALFRGGKGQAPLEDHATALWLADTRGVLLMRYAGNPLDVPRLLRELAAVADLQGPRKATTP